MSRNSVLSTGPVYIAEKLPIGLLDRFPLTSNAACYNGGMGKNQRQEIFKYVHDESFSLYVHDLMRTRLAMRTASVLDDRNIYGYRHGKSWITNKTDFERDTVQLKVMSAERTVHTKDIVDNDVKIIETYINGFVEQLSSQFMRNLYETVSAAADSAGNTVDQKKHGGDFAAGFFEAMRKVEFGTDRFGRPEPPQVHLHPSMLDKAMASLKNQPLAFHERVETLKMEKERAATKREAERISKFRW